MSTLVPVRSSPKQTKNDIGWSGRTGNDDECKKYCIWRGRRGEIVPGGSSQV